MSMVRSSVHAKWIVGKVIGTKMQKTAKVRVTRLVLDPYLLKHYNKRKTYFAHNALQQCTTGDIVLLKALPVPRTKHVKHEQAEIVFNVGKVIDPVTGKPCAGTTYLESPLSLETTQLSKNLEELNISSAQGRRNGRSSQRERLTCLFYGKRNFSKFHHKLCPISLGIYKIVK
ncbi:PREDICTED: 28S ribosomal protein S17, mitochondrial [Cercocebus atys]|uniref:28S ribosomal protein S17, mitochondrial n=1 Tax=Cercocebus atys TaxID=9531 RepID=UPI0005F5202D|nr:PREDICTED: 28S ribosomal protein S17, mitochondrial [Cercocebus atys]